nr:hypothetical protein [Brevibacterium aurantiacum]
MSWAVAGSADAPGLEDRRVVSPVTGPEVVAALSSQALVWVAGFEGSTSPTWATIIGGQVSLFNVVRDRLPGVDNANRPPSACDHVDGVCRRSI